MPTENRQTLLFSATMPKWVSKVSRKYQTNPQTVDLVGEENTGKLADSITLFLQQVENHAKITAVQDLLQTYATGKGGKAIVFVNTKARADEVAGVLQEFTGVDALHGDIGQAQREKVSTVACVLSLSCCTEACTQGPLKYVASLAGQRESGTTQLTAAISAAYRLLCHYPSQAAPTVILSTASLKHRLTTDMFSVVRGMPFYCAWMLHFFSVL